MYDRATFYRAISALAPSSAWADELVTAQAVAAEAGALLLKSFGRVEPRQKADGSLVTDADLAADRLITERLRAAFPSDELLSEEGATEYMGADRLWVVDPLDGTTNYSHGVPLWGVTLALVQGGRPVVGVSHFPCLRLSFWAVLGRGAWQGEQQLATVHDATLSATDLVTCCSRTPRDFEVTLGGKGRMLGSEALNLALVARGTVHVSLAATSHVWDLAAGWLLVEEAGGVIERMDGGSVWPLTAGDFGARTFATQAAGNAALMTLARAQVRPRGT